MEAEQARRYAAAERFVDWLQRRLIAAASGSNESGRPNDPLASFWMGRLAPAAEIAASDLGDRAERLEPCAIGMKLRLQAETLPCRTTAAVSFSLWHRVDDVYEKIGPIKATAPLDISLDGMTIDRKPIDEAIHAVAPGMGLRASVEGEIMKDRDGAPILELTLVNRSEPPNEEIDRAWARGRLFECGLEVVDLATEPFLLEALPDGFRYDRNVPAWGINCGVNSDGSRFRTVDLPEARRMRPTFWTVATPEPDMRFGTLARDPIPSCEKLLRAVREWGRTAWSDEAIRCFCAEWTRETAEHVATERAHFEREVERIATGVELLKADDRLRRSFMLMNEAIGRSARERYDRWRPFQLGFMLANLVACRCEDADVVDIVWFPTGGGKTETYLGLVLTTAFHDRFRGKSTGISAWARFPLRLLSLQQTQRFANALAAAELVRQEQGVGGDPFGLGFLIGGSATPNSIKDAPVSGSARTDWTANDPSLGERCQQLAVCPFCRERTVRARLNRKLWRLEHLCANDGCSWPTKTALPIWVVDDDVWRFLPTVVVGTLDKAANVSRQASMRGLYTAPLGHCSTPDHGHTYAARSNRPSGCLVPGCRAKSGRVPQADVLYAPTLRLQDELHLLRDSLGAVDAHYEALLDDLQMRFTGTKPKILGSSATLSGFERQCEVLYQRAARVFPHPEPRVGRGFWVGDTDREMRRFLAAAPRGLTIEYAVDRTIVTLQTAVRDVLRDPAGMAEEIGINEDLVPFVVDAYGTNVVYGNTLRDLDAVSRSAETQWGDIPSPDPQLLSMTGRTAQVEISDALRRLETPEHDFEDRIHVVTASSMMSHGVDVDRLNVMVVLGLPLTTAEFIQATARVGRRWPSLVLVMHKIGRERDASVYRSFPQWVLQGDRFVEPIPITGASRRVLERTIPGIAFARLLAIHEPEHGKGLWKAKDVRARIQNVEAFTETEVEAVVSALGFDEEGKEALRSDVEDWYARFVRNVSDAAAGNDWAMDLSPTAPPMLSLRDVEEQVDVWGRDPE